MDNDLTVYLGNDSQLSTYTFVNVTESVIWIRFHLNIGNIPRQSRAQYDNSFNGAQSLVDQNFMWTTSRSVPSATTRCSTAHYCIAVDESNVYIKATVYFMREEFKLDSMERYTFDDLCVINRNDRSSNFSAALTLAASIEPHQFHVSFEYDLTLDNQFLSELTKIHLPKKAQKNGLSSEENCKTSELRIWVKNEVHVDSALVIIGPAKNQGVTLRHHSQYPLSN